MTTLKAVFVALALLSIPLAAGDQATGIVSETRAEFSIPVAHPPGAWRWKRAETQEKALEYRWGVCVKRGAEEYEFGFSLFKLSDAREGSGRLEELLKAGQASVWKLKDDRKGATIVEGAAVLASAQDGRVLVEILDAGLLRLLFGDRPASVRIVAKTPETVATTVEIPVQYRH